LILNSDLENLKIMNTVMHQRDIVPVSQRNSVLGDTARGICV